MLYITRSPSLGPRELLLLIPQPAKAVPHIAYLLSPFFMFLLRRKGYINLAVLLL